MRGQAARAFQKSRHFTSPVSIYTLVDYARPIVNIGNQTGEGWFLTGEMVELIHSGVNNIVCTQPFGCLPNHIVGKGMIRKLKDEYPYSNVVAIDYDPGATRINQENRIKLMLAVGRERLAERQAVPHTGERTERSTPRPASVERRKKTAHAAV